MHALIYLDNKDKFYNSERIDHIISAEIPDKVIHPHLYGRIKQHMIHGPCEKQNRNSPFMNQNKSACTKQFPKPFALVTNYNVESGYPIYRRRNDGRIIKYGSNHIANNQFVVPYNPYLLLTFNCHINVEICSTIKAIKYLFKYLYKGPNSALIGFKTNNNTNNLSQSNISSENEECITNNYDYDEIEQYLSTRYVCPPEAMYRLLEFKLYDHSHVIYRLAVHLENEQLVYFKQGSENKLLDSNVNTTLTAWFELNKIDSSSRKLLYIEIPNYYVYDKKTKLWTQRKKTK